MELRDEVLSATLTLNDDVLVLLWNKFIEESGVYGEDSSIYDLQQLSDCKELCDIVSKDDLPTLLKNVADGTRYVQYLLQGGVRQVVSIRDVIKAYWDDIFDRILVFPSIYSFYTDNEYSLYFEDIVYPIILRKCGYTIDSCKGELNKLDK